MPKYKKGDTVMYPMNLSRTCECCEASLENQQTVIMQGEVLGIAPKKYIVETAPGSCIHIDHHVADAPVDLSVEEFNQALCPLCEKYMKDLNKAYMAALEPYAKEDCPAHRNGWPNCPANFNGGGCPATIDCWAMYFKEVAAKEKDAED